MDGGILYLSQITQPRDRHSRRGIEQEYKKIFMELEEVEKRFIHSLWTSENPYRPIYLSYLDNFKAIAKWWNEYGKLKYCIVDEEYFAKCYAPQAEERMPWESDNMADLFTFLRTRYGHA